MIKIIVKIYHAVTDFILNNSSGSKLKWRDKQ